MAKIKNVYEQIISDENIHHAYLNARRGKRYRRQVLEFTKNLERNLIEIQDELKKEIKNYPKYREFYIYEPKCRLILSQDFKEVVKQWAFYQVLSPLFAKMYISDSYACIKGKGQIAAVKRLYYWLRLVNAPRYNATKKGLDTSPMSKWYYLKIDFSKYFYRVDHEVMLKVLRHKIKDDRVVQWLETRIKSPDMPFGLPAGMKPEDVDINDRLYDKGMPVGALVSQMLANVYNDQIDQYAKRILGIHYYIRYQDDIIILSDDKKQIKEWHRKMEKFANEVMKMELNDKTCIRPINQGIEFCGFRLWATHVKIRKSTALKMKRNLKGVMHRYNKGDITLEKANQVVSSYLGLLKHCDSYALRTEIFGDYEKGKLGWFVLTKNKDGY